MFTSAFGPRTPAGPRSSASLPSPPAPGRVQAKALTPVQQALAFRTAADPQEREADRVADAVIHGSAPAAASALGAEGGEAPGRPALQAKPLEGGGAGASSAPAASALTGSHGRPLDDATRAFMEPRFGVGFGQVRTHADGRAADACHALGAQAFTYGHHIYFGRGRVPGADALTAHELTHVVQQQGPRPGDAPVGGLGRRPGAAAVQPKLELRPPGKGEASAFHRAQELVDRLNTVSPAYQYELKDRDLIGKVVDPAGLSHFDTVMKGFIDRAEVVPMRLITAKGYVGGGPLFADSFASAYVDLDDLLADDLFSFQSDLLHFLTERFAVKNYDRRIGTNLDPLFDKAHAKGKNAEAAQLQAVFRDPSIIFLYEDNGEPWVNAFKSKDLGYRVFQVVHHREREVAGGKMWVQKTDGTRISMEDFQKERAAPKP